jgi:membrane glycosyltransferase
MFAARDTAEGLASERRWGFVVFNLIFLWLGTVLMGLQVSENGWIPGSLALLALYVVLLAQAVYGFTLAATGWWLLRHGGDPVRLNQTLPVGTVPGQVSATAIVMPIFNEEVSRVFHALRVMYESLHRTGHGEAFHFFILSDSSDPNHWIAEEKAWFELCSYVNGFGRIFYRKRRSALHHKSGNIADFCRRWGVNYRYMIVLDADSIMTGAAFVRLASLMETNPQVGIIQTNTKLVLGRSLFQRFNQFASHVYGPLFVAGANFWQLDNANYYGHNAIIRLRPFMKHCAMPELPESGPLGRRILSHDTVEAAFMRRAGYDVWSDYDLEGSYEEGPPHLLASLQRDRRWCHGNLQHLWFLFAPGLTICSRINILVGILAYAGSPLWLLFLLLSPLLFLGGNPPGMSGLLFTYVMGLLLLPKSFAALQRISPVKQPQAGGGRGQMLLNVLAEILYSMLLAPILMLFYTKFVWSSFFGGGTKWGRQQRTDDEGPSWRQCIAAHWGHTVLVVAVSGLLVWLAPAMLPWLLLVVIGPLLSIPFCRMLASNALGLKSRAKGWFVIPEETHPPWELEELLEPDEPPISPFAGVPDFAADVGLLQAVVDPYVNAIHASLLHERSQISGGTHEFLIILGDRLLREGPGALTPAEKRRLLWDADAMQTVHVKLWHSSPSDVHEWWQQAFQRFNDSHVRAARRHSVTAYKKADVHA